VQCTKWLYKHENSCFTKLYTQNLYIQTAKTFFWILFEAIWWYIITDSNVTSIKGYFCFNSATMFHIDINTTFSVIQVIRNQYNVICLVLLNPYMCCKKYSLTMAPMSELTSFWLTIVAFSEKSI